MPGLELPETPEAERAQPRPADAATTPTSGVAYGQRIAKKPLKRLFLGQTAVDFWGQPQVGARDLAASLVVISVISLSTRRAQPRHRLRGRRGVRRAGRASSRSTTHAAVLDDNGLDGTDAKVEERSSSSGDIVKVQIEDQPEDVRVARAGGARRGGRGRPEPRSAWRRCRRAGASRSPARRSRRWSSSSRSSPSSSRSASSGAWPSRRSSRCCTTSSSRPGIYSIFGFEVTPPTVIAFLTILGYSLYDTIVVFDRVRENERRVAAAGLSAADLVNVSANQVLMRSLNTSIVGDPAGDRAAGHRRRPARPGHAARVRHRPADRHADRRLLVDLPGDADPRHAEALDAPAAASPPARSTTSRARSSARSWFGASACSPRARAAAGRRVRAAGDEPVVSDRSVYGRRPIDESGDTLVAERPQSSLAAARRHDRAAARRARPARARRSATDALRPPAGRRGTLAGAAARSGLGPGVVPACNVIT